MASSPSSPIQAPIPLSLPTNLTPRPNGTRKVSTATFGHGQRESLLVPVTDDERSGQYAATSPITAASRTKQETAIPETECPDDGLYSPSSFHTASGTVTTPTPFGDHDHPDILVPPETPQTSTSLASITSDTSTLGPLATQQDIKNDPHRILDRQQSQRRKLGKIFGNGVKVEADETSGKASMKVIGESIEQLSELDDWLLVNKCPDLCNSKLERTLGQGADSAHLALNTDYRRRSPDIDECRFSEDSSLAATTPLLKTVPLGGRPAFHVHSTSDLLNMTHLADTTSRLVRSGSFSHVLENGKRTFARLNHGPSVLRRKRSLSPESHVNAGPDQSTDYHVLETDFKPVDDFDSDERKILWNRTRKLGRVLGETLKESEVGKHVVGTSMPRPVVDTHEPPSIPAAGDEGVERSVDGQGGKSQPTPPLRQQNSPDIAVPINSCASGKNLATCSSSTSDYRLSHFPSTANQVRRYSDPVSPMISSASTEEFNFGDLQTSPAGTVEQTKQQRRMRLDKLNRLLGAHIPPELIGPTIYIGQSTFSQEQIVDNSAVDEPEEDASDRKKRAVKVASKMFSVFGEPPPAGRCSFNVQAADASAISSETGAKGDRSRLETSVALYHQTITSIRYLLEHDRQSLHTVMDNFENSPILTNVPDPEVTALPVIMQETQLAQSSDLRRKRSLSSPSPMKPLTALGASQTAPLRSLSDDTQDFKSFTDLRKRATKLNAFFGDPRVGSGHIGRQSEDYRATDRKAALERLLLELEDDANYHAEHGELKEDELEAIRSRLLDARRSASMQGDPLQGETSGAQDTL